MQKILGLTLMLITLILFSATQTHIQAQTQTTNTASDTRSTQAVPSGDALTIANQRTEKVLNDLDKSEAEKHSLERENAALQKNAALSEALHLSDQAMLKSKDDELSVFRKMKCNTSSFLFGLYKKKSCY